jgi:hypothetical protein
MSIIVCRNSGYRHGPCRASWLALFSRGRRASDVHLEDPHDPAAITIDVRHLSSAAELDQVTWVSRSIAVMPIHCLRWVVGDTEALEARAPAMSGPIAAVRRIHVNWRAWRSPKQSRTDAGSAVRSGYVLVRHE